MKHLIIYFTIILGFISCGFNEEKITQAEFARLFSHDSIYSIQVNENKQEVEIKTKPFHESGKIYILPIESTKSFETSFSKLRNTLDAQNIHIGYSMAVTSGSDFPFYFPLISIVILLCMLILFLFTIIDILKSRFEPATDKLIWVIAVVFIPLIGPILYLFIGRKQKLVI
jgi:ATP-dependent Zn protease